ncbi:MAG: peptidase C39 family protein [Rhodospirillales bacterium]
MIRPAVATDLDALVHIEARAFATDRFSRRSFRYLLSRANAITLVDADDDGRVRGYVMVLFNRGTSLARLYSIARDPTDRGTGLGAALLTSAEQIARERDAAYMRLEVRADAEATEAFYRSHGYRRFDLQPHYYEDDVAAVRMQKSLAPRPDPALLRVPYYAQSLDFTCGPAALLMAMRAHDPSVRVDPSAEVRIWRESTTVFMTSGLGGCSPEGLALAAHRRGFTVSIFISDRGVMFLESVRSPMKRNVIRMVEEDFRQQCALCGIPVEFQPLTIDLLRERVAHGDIPIVLISSYRISREKQPHWVVVTGFDDRYVYLHDPHVAEHLDKTATDCMQIPVKLSRFVEMARYGRVQHHAAVFVGPGPLGREAPLRELERRDALAADPVTKDRG